MSEENRKPTGVRCGYVAIVGRPNVGKSTLLNHILGQKISITSRKPQTTRHRVLGIHTRDDVQVVFVDTPGLHSDGKKAINRYMNRAAGSALRDVDIVIFVIDARRWTDDDDWVMEQVGRSDRPVILAINKVDQVERKEELLPRIEELASKYDFAEIVPLSALKKQNLESLETVIARYLPQGEHFFPEDQITDRSERFLASELVREKVMRQLGEEVPYALAVEIEEFERRGRILHIRALILVEREGQKKIVIGDKGGRIKQIGREARLDMEAAFESKVMLTLWAKVRAGWSDDERALRSLGYGDE